jgi:hypothetical protein
MPNIEQNFMPNNSQSDTGRIPFSWDFVCDSLLRLRRTSSRRFLHPRRKRRSAFWNVSQPRSATITLAAPT